MYRLQYNPDNKTPKFSQIVQSIVADIERGVLKNGDQLPSLSELSTEYEVSRFTVVRAYQELVAQGSCVSEHGRGYFVRSAPVTKLKVLLIFNKLSSYKKRVYYAFLEALGERAHVDLQIHHYSSRKLGEILDQSLGKYNHYVIMPHFMPENDEVDYRRVLARVPA
jgi:DNA-binding transcriptional regulator YhcF (GntR family)